jgi:transcription elongation GreA/GreB family factor
MEEKEHTMTSTTSTIATASVERGERAVRPMLTRGGAQLLAERVAGIRHRRLGELVPLLVEPERDERHVAEFEHVLAEADRWDAFLNSADILDLDPSAFDGRVGLGVRVQVLLVDESSAWVRTVHPLEAFLDDERISLTSPLGAALLGARVGDEVVVQAPVGNWTCRILAVDIETAA